MPHFIVPVVGGVMGVVNNDIGKTGFSCTCTGKVLGVV